MPDREKRGEEQGRSVRRCPEIQDVVIRQLEERERARGRERERERLNSEGKRGRRVHLKEKGINFPVAVTSRHPSACAQSGTLQLALGSVVVQCCRRPDRASRQREEEGRDT